MRRTLVLAVVAMVVAGCGDDTTSTTPPVSTSTTIAATTVTTTTSTTVPPTTTTTAPAPPPLAEVTLTLEQVGGRFAAPIFLTVRPGDDRLFVVNQTGVIQSMSREGEELTSVLDISPRVDYGGERGLLGVAFHPSDPERLFVHFSRAGNGATVIQEYRFPIGADQADPDPVADILSHAQPAGNHNGGMITFGADGYLYIALGDGGGAGDTYEQGQNPHTLLGAILRIDVDGDRPYEVPMDNPFADGEDGAPEVWLWGLRNPWRLSFDGTDMWIGDVGQGQREEIDLVHSDQGGGNLGWPILEGSRCFDGPQSLCDDNDFIAPVYDYTHDGGRCSVTGGYVYRGTAYPELTGAYFFGDYCSGDIMVIRVVDGQVVDEAVFDHNLGALTSFGVDHDGELFVVANNAVYRIGVDA